jgi:hypothetical protein
VGCGFGRKGIGRTQGGVEVSLLAPADRKKFTEVSRKAYPEIIPAEYVPMFVDAAEKARKQ